MQAEIWTGEGKRHEKWRIYSNDLELCWHERYIYNTHWQLKLKVGGVTFVAGCGWLLHLYKLLMAWDENKINSKDYVVIEDINVALPVWSGKLHFQTGWVSIRNHGYVITYKWKQQHTKDKCIKQFRDMTLPRYQIWKFIYQSQFFPLFFSHIKVDSFQN